MGKPLAVVPDLELELDNIYSLPPAQFTSARNDLARRLKQAGRDEAAAEVKQRRKPTVPVWAVNQVARLHPDEVAALLQSSEQLRVAQGRALGGGDAGSLRKATAAQRQALQTLTQHGHDLLAQEGHSPTSQTIERIASTLRAAALDPGSRELLVRGGWARNSIPPDSTHSPACPCLNGGLGRHGENQPRANGVRNGCEGCARTPARPS